MRQFQAGRSSVREALRALALARVIDIRPGSGTYVRAGKPADGGVYQALALSVERNSVQHLAEAREFVESGAARLAAVRRDQRDLEGLASAVQRMQAAAEGGDAERFSTADVDFHFQVANATNNPVVVKIYQAIGELLVKSFHRSNADVATLRAAAARHARILDAIEAGKPELAASVTMDNLSVANHLLDHAYALYSPHVDSELVLPPTSDRSGPAALDNYEEQWDG